MDRCSERDLAPRFLAPPQRPRNRFIDCPVHGQTWTTSLGDCEKCDDTARKQAEAHAYRLGECNLHGRYREATFEGFKASSPAQTAVLNACSEFVDQVAAGKWAAMLLLGAPGVGKTHLGAAMVNRMIHQRQTAAAMYTPGEIVRWIRKTWRRDSEVDEDFVLTELTRPVLLVLDEVGVGVATEGEQRHLFEVIDARYAQRRPVVVLSNLLTAQVREAIGDRSYDRIRESCRVLVCDWASHRGNA